jgi:hypothetical protein
VRFQAPSGRTRASCAAAVLALALAAGAPLEGGAAPAPEMHDVWVGRLLAARQAVEQARARQAANRSLYSRMRHSNARGEKRGELVEERGEAKKALAEAEARLAALLEEARRAGVPPGWVREAMEGFEASPPARAE